MNETCTLAQAQEAMNSLTFVLSPGPIICSFRCPCMYKWELHGFGISDIHSAYTNMLLSLDHIAYPLAAVHGMLSMEIVYMCIIACKLCPFLEACTILLPPKI